MSSGTIPAVALAAANILVIKTLNEIVTEPYMDEPFHVPQAQAYCRGEWDVWDPKLTTPPGLYALSIVLNRVFMFKCTLPMLRLTPLVASLALPPLLTLLLGITRRERVRDAWTRPSLEAVVLAAFPVAWFFTFLYYTELPSLVFVLATVVAGSKGHHTLAALLGAVSCTFRQTNIVWVLYAYAANRLSYLRFRRVQHGDRPLATLHDPPAAEATPADLVKACVSVLQVIPALLETIAPYAAVLGGFAAFVVWNGGIVLGDKSNHIPTLHVPQFYYFLGFSAIFGWPVLISGKGGPVQLARDIIGRMFGTKQRLVVSVALSAFIATTVHFFTIHHPFLLADNRHYTFYVWRRVFMLHPAVPYLLSPFYLACGWAWFLRMSYDRTLLQVLLLPLAALPTLLPTPLLEPRYFIIPYVLLRTQIVDVPAWAVALEGLWYAAINAATMYVFLYKERFGQDGVIRFMW
ncbi:glucosyltransferase [Exidia glandulosa HHB12029]|uniref:Dol-P-Glc:Glc(2)Man(9)GlcNAc(2)-PP-Dol alpha-1,2-glucosyltransferase n=1 Tax=Exidia glandulosa HHB12029 TaxID=1314781 RepID=A0A165NE40_EXIGL|nr:glucosyltransferase [Exidia glandulosa HHB12029]